MPCFFSFILLSTILTTFRSILTLWTIILFVFMFFFGFVGYSHIQFWRANTTNKVQVTTLPGRLLCCLPLVGPTWGKLRLIFGGGLRLRQLQTSWSILLGCPHPWRVDSTFQWSSVIKKITLAPFTVLTQIFGVRLLRSHWNILPSSLASFSRNPATVRR